MHWSCRVWLGPGKLGRPLGECPMLPAQASVLCFFMWTSQKGEKEERGRVGTTSGPLRKEGNSIVYPPTLKYDKTHIMTQKIESRFRSTSWAQSAARPGHSLLQPYLCTALSQTILQHHQDLTQAQSSMASCSHCTEEQVEAQVRERICCQDETPQELGPEVTPGLPTLETLGLLLSHSVVPAGP